VRVAFEDGPGPQQFGTVHGVKVSNDGLVYVEDRNNRRSQIFTADGKYATQVFINRNSPTSPHPRRLEGQPPYGGSWARPAGAEVNNQTR